MPATGRSLKSGGSDHSEWDEDDDEDDDAVLSPSLGSPSLSLLLAFLLCPFSSLRENLLYCVHLSKASFSFDFVYFYPSLTLYRVISSLPPLSPLPLALSIGTHDGSLRPRRQTIWVAGGSCRARCSRTARIRGPVYRAQVKGLDFFFIMQFLHSLFKRELFFFSTSALTFTACFAAEVL